MGKQQWELSADKLRRTCDAGLFTFESTGELNPAGNTFGQDRALKAIDFGLKIKGFGYNLFVSGTSGTGKNATVRQHIQRVASNQPTPSDWCYVHCFVDQHRPKAIELPVGKGSELARDMEEFIGVVKREIPRAFDDESYEGRKADVVRDIQNERESLSNQLQEQAKSQGFSLEATQLGMITVPLIDGKPVSNDEFEALPDDQKKEIREKGEGLKAEFNQVVAKAKKLEKQAGELVAQLDKEIVLAAIGPALQSLRTKYDYNDQLRQYINEIEKNILENIDDFKASDKEEDSILALGKPSKGDITERFKVNVLADNKDVKGAPVVFEDNPTYYNLFGRIDYRARLTGMITDFDMVKGGAIHRANGGYLVVQARDLLLSPLSWDALKRTLRSGQARIENIGDQYSAIPTVSLRPDTIPVDVKVILVGTPMLYHLLYQMDEDFRELFRVRADFDTNMARTEENMRRYAELIAERCQEQKLSPFDRSAVCRIVEYGSRLAEDQDKLSTRLMDIKDIVTEASFWAADEGKSLVSAVHVDKAIEERVYRSSLIEQRIGELIENGTIMIDTAGAVTGQVNGLSVQAFGDHQWGKPARVTARTSIGRAGIVNIERETQMSGRIHNKGFLTLSGYLIGKYGGDKPLTLSGSVTFEQMYDEIDGDSASGAELYALLSSLSGLPLRQNLAVTGSVNQHGEVQAIGGVTSKIEGFFDVCRAKGLTGDQGVIIPESNVRNLMLREDIVDAVREGKFHVYAVKYIDEGIQLLTGVRAGQRRQDGSYEPGTVHYRVDQALRGFADGLKSYAMSSQHVATQETNGRAAARAEKKRTKAKAHECNGECENCPNKRQSEASEAQKEA